MFLTWSDLEIEKELGSGQAGSVFLAKLSKRYGSLPAGSYVALKCYKSWVFEQPGQYERILRELDSGRSIHHPNLVETLTIVSNPENMPVLVMKYYQGETLEQYLSHQRAINEIAYPEQVLAFVGKIASALNTLHSDGIIHRDLKPANIMVANSEPILMDLGIVHSSKFPEQTTSNAFLGTIRYAAPEYLFGEDYDSSIDVFSLGAIAWEMLAGRQYLSDETNWARMIARKSKARRVPFDFSWIQKRFGVNGVEFVKDFFALTLGSKKTRILSSELNDAFESRLWECPYHKQEYRFLQGEAPSAKVGDWSLKPTRVSFSEAWKDFIDRTNENDRMLLRNFLDGHYWEHMSLLPYNVRPDPDHLARLSDYGLIRTDYHNTTWTCEIHEVVRLGYRYRVL